ncbi:MAG TPA: 5-(carboxyamino)imidazole ribonucleotide mutase [Planctomycetota bacterium]|nr:5-(carboxyamino)imidazole ribonucleotide mutase [Planctomycetota bacterium]
MSASQAPSPLNPLVSIVMGSDSDLPKIEGCLEVLREFGVPCEVNVISAHRTPGDAQDFAKNADARGIRVIIAAAGGAAHLAGVLASLTALPVIGVPISSSALQGVDALYSTVQMPPGVPVATVGIDGSRNAAILAVQILGVADPRLRAELLAYKERLAAGVRQKSRNLKEKLNPA